MQLAAGKGYLKFAEFRVDRANHELKKTREENGILKASIDGILESQQRTFEKDTQQEKDKVKEYMQINSEIAKEFNECKVQLKKFTDANKRLEREKVIEHLKFSEEVERLKSNAKSMEGKVKHLDQVNSHLKSELKSVCRENDYVVSVLTETSKSLQLKFQSLEKEVCSSRMHEFKLEEELEALRSENNSLKSLQIESSSYANSESHLKVLEACQENPMQSFTSVSLDNSILCTNVLAQKKESTESVNNTSDFIIGVDILMCGDFSTQPLLSSSLVMNAHHQQILDLHDLSPQNVYMFLFSASIITRCPDTFHCELNDSRPSLFHDSGFLSLTSHIDHSVSHTTREGRHQLISSGNHASSNKNYRTTYGKEYPPFHTRILWNSKYLEERAARTRSDVSFHPRVNQSTDGQTVNQPTNLAPSLASSSTKCTKKKSCFISGCNIQSTHLKQHVIGKNLPKFVSNKSSLTLEEQMSSYEHLLQSLARKAGCLSLSGLLNLVRKRRWYPHCRTPILKISDGDLELMRNFHYWLYGKDLQDEPAISPPNSVASLIQWHILSYLSDHISTVPKCSTAVQDLKDQKYNSRIWISSVKNDCYPESASQESCNYVNW